ncbi:MAG: assimilatory sulfite reductase (NADPH) flavoprotein subunit [Halomonas sp.]|nr:assimilatory sulfite reductase (NADPH) flavoprotein subunit [Halomonas sp.]MDN6297221.1 assimilatory sulfite reductase (NADPH) flavoprotein subunit [Halomonas sp.]MDN6314722.1 assimilatory sulfite reductase (NADPH) flavoprotein subunit [Halomonas sp.]MDN6335843.1 assimilatory sulfite reductase (NADPH) flavoprotein subunit [Halomonas sp.]
MKIDPSNSPLSADQANGLNRLLETLAPHQFDWLAGFIAGHQAAQPGSPAAAAASQSTADAGQERPSLTVLYGSQTGNCEGLAEALGEQANAHGIDARVLDMADYKPRQLKSESYVVVVTSTHGEGEPPDNALDLHEFIHGRKAPSLKHLQYGVLALGDTSYEHYCQTGKDFDAAFAKLGATALIERADCDVDYDDEAEAWCKSLIERLQNEAGASGVPTAGGVSPAPTTEAYTRRYPFMAEVLDNQWLNGRGSSKETRHIELSLEGSGLSYQPGDSLGLYPQNAPSLVAGIIERLGLDADTPVTAGDIETTLAGALKHHREITLLTRPVIEKWATLSGSAKLAELTADHAGLTDWLYGRDLLDLAEEAPVEGLDAQTLIDTLRKLPPRLYSIASSQAAVDDEVHLTVAAVRYETEGRKREGVASTWLADRLAEDTAVPAYIEANKHFRLPEDDAAPVIMIGPGTGIAPFRAFMQEREEREAEGANWLLFGDRNFHSDFLYQSEWLAWRRQGVVDRIDVAFSRDQGEKVYVQQRLRENAGEVWRWLERGAYLYVCGDADKMAPDVHQALLDVIMEAGGKNLEDATDYLRELTRQKRYQRDIY